MATRLSPRSAELTSDVGKDASIITLTAKMPPAIASVFPLCSSAQPSSFSKKCWTLPFGGSSVAPLSQNADIIGVSSLATSSEKKTATATVTPNCLKNCPGMPPINATGKNTTMMVMVVATTPVRSHLLLPAQLQVVFYPFEYA